MCSIVVELRGTNKKDSQPAHAIGELRHGFNQLKLCTLLVAFYSFGFSQRSTMYDKLIEVVCQCHASAICVQFFYSRLGTPCK